MAKFLGRPFDLKPGRPNDKKSTLRRVFSQPPSIRMDGQIYEVEKILQENSFLTRYAGTHQLSSLIRSMYLRTYEPHSIIASQGDKGDTFYIVLSGRIAVLNPDQGSQKIKELIQSNSFGEECLLSDSFYPFTYTAIENSELILLNKKIFDSSIKTMERQIIHDSFVFFKSLPLLSKVSEKLIHYFSQIAFIKRFMPNSVIVKQDEFASGIFVISEGSAKVVRKVKKKKIVIDELGVGEFFCEGCFFSKAPMHHSVICSMPLVTYYLDKLDLSKLEPYLLQEFKKACKPYPEDQVLIKMYNNEKNWKSFKDQIVRSIVVEKELRKGFDSRLRKPNLFYHKDLLFNTRLPTMQRSRIHTASSGKRAKNTSID